ncbi:MAG TPA: tripartite tricarboxylate transporter substrate binding protein [Xanthobacteraceae bacterium]|jgi:tripartite-type tricarboxylate transporter receptor subunit TctC|nr:tripartite tricarboxylate transporter substrate binding protein [Xanthobacteraceae bacterium]
MRKFAALAASALMLAGALLVAPHARADDYPSRPIKLLVGAPPGGTTDTIARSIAVPMATALKQIVIVENKPGAGGNIAAEATAKAAPDGYTLLVSFSSHTINASLYEHLPYDPAADFTAITKVATVPSLLVGNPKLPAEDLKSVIALAKAQPDKLTIGIGGIGSSLHLAGEKFKLMTGSRLLNVPYKGTAPALTDLLSGQTDLMFISLVTGAAQVHAGNLRAYGVTSAERQPAFPDVPAIAEVVPGFESNAWFGVFGPAKLPPEITRKLHAAIVAGLSDPEMQKRLKTEGATPVGDSSDDFAAFVRDDIKRWAPIVKASGATVE